MSTAVGSEISTILHSFYTKLYNQSAVDVKERDNFWENIVLPQISPAQANLLKSVEVRHAIKQLKNYKAPGLDGLPSKFYKILGLKLEDTLMAVFNSFL